MNAQGPSCSRCPGEEVLSALADPSAIPTLEVAKHLAECPACRGALADLRRLDGLLRSNFPPHAACPAHELVASFLDGALAAGDAEEVLAHIASCPLCDVQLQFYKQLMDDAPDLAQVPEEVIRAVKSFAYAGTALPARNPAPAPQALPAAQTGNGVFAARFALAAVAAAAGVLLAVLLLSQGVRKSVSDDPLNPSDYPDPSVDGRIEPAPGESPFPEMIEGGDESSEFDPGEEENREVNAPESEPAPAPPASTGEPSTPPPPGRQGTEVERNPLPGEGTPSGPAVPPSPGSNPPTRPGGTGDAAVSLADTPFVGEAFGTIACKTAAGWTWLRTGGPLNLAPGSVLSPGLQGLGRIAFQGAGEVDFHAASKLSVLPARSGISLRLETGEIAVSHSGGAPVAIDSGGVEIVSRPGALFDAVRDGNAVSVYVIEGEVLCRVEGGEIALDAGESFHTDRAKPGAKSTAFDPATIASWRSPLLPLEVEVFREGFNGGSSGWNGKAEKHETFRHSAGSIRSSRVRDARLSCAVSKVNHAPLFAFRPDIRIRMAVKAEKCRDLSLRLWDPEQKAFHVLSVRVAPGRWSRLDVGLRNAFGPRGPRPGALITGIVIGAAGRDAGFVLDDLSIVRIPGPCPIAIRGFSTEPECACTCRSVCLCCRTARTLQLLRKLELEISGASGDKESGRDRVAGIDEGDKGGSDKGESGGDGHNSPQSGGPGGSWKNGGQGPGEAPSWPSDLPPPPNPVGPFPGLSGSADRPRIDPQEPGVPTTGDAPAKSPPPSAEPAGARPVAGLSSAEKEQLFQWLRSTLPGEWPPYPGWESHCCVQGCSCLQIVKRYWNRYRMKTDE